LKFSHRKNLETLGYEDWVQEQIGMREILKNFANISKDDIFGMRAPHLKPGKNAQYEVKQLSPLSPSFLSIEPPLLKE